MQFGKQFSRAAIELFPTNHTKPTRLTTEKNILADGHFLHQRKFLENYRYACVFSVSHAAKPFHFIFNYNLAAVVGIRVDATQDLH